MLNAKLIDKRSPAEDWDRLLEEVRTATVLGLDCETQDEARHEGLNAYNNAKRHVFDHRRTTMTGFSVYSEGSDTAWYLNLAHADRPNRLEQEKALEVLAAIPDHCLVIAHNAPFELVMFKQCLGVQLKNVVCTLQMAVSHHDADEYDPQDFAATPLTAFRKFVPDILREFAGYQLGDGLKNSQAELLGKFIAKESKAAHSCNGFVSEIAIGYNLKKLVKSIFGVTMQTYAEVLAAGGARHMGELTGEQVVSYGADDAYWAVQLYSFLKSSLLKNNPAALVAFLKTTFTD